MSSKWTPEKEGKLMLILLAHYSKPGNGPNWDTVAQLMGEEYTASAVGQHYTKKMVKRETFVEAKQVFGNAGKDGGSTSGGSPGKKRKVSDVIAKKEEGE
jgi:hypothetical protein